MATTATRQAPEPPLTSNEVMRILGISRNTFWRYMHEYPGEFRTYRSGRWRVMDREDLARWREFRKQHDAA